MKSSPVKSFFLFLFFLIAVGASSAAGYFFYQNQKLNKLANNPEAVAKEETQGILKEISKTVQLPEEEPTVATIVDKTKLTEQPFFNQAENGDKVLFYTTAGKAFLYRPSTKKIIDVTLINITQDKSQAGKVAGASTDETTTPVPTREIEPTTEPTKAVETVEPTTAPEGQ